MPRQLLSVYPQDTPRFDEMFAAPGAVRPHWRPLWDALVGSRPEDMRRRLRYVARQIHENGITYNVYADPQGTDRPWEVDLLPLIIAPEEWQQIERAVAQRATLLNTVLANLYGPQRLLGDGVLPPALIYGHGGYLRPCHGIAPPGGVYLHIYAADLARAPDGRWWVIADRTQAPSGAGYALENRLVVSRVFPELFRDLRVQHLAEFFSTLRDSLAHWAPTDGGEPVIVLLTPGPYNETYFEHAYLARYLGFPLVEGHDLTVRGGCVWLKTLSGLQRVHAIVRRLDDDYSDPLELRSDSALGVPGLTQAARLGNVLIANALGSNILESGALHGFLPGLCERLLGQTLAMPTVATWWCGQPDALEDAISKLDQLVIKRAFPDTRMEPVFGDQLDEAQRAALIARMRAAPEQFVAQELVQLAQAPVWDKSHLRRLHARAVGLRVFACATPSGYVVMPGGLTRVASQAHARVLSMQRGGSSKDTWVIASGPVSTLSLLRRTIAPEELVRGGANLSSRMVENLFWFGRHAERCDNTARLLRLTLSRLTDDESPSSAEWAPLETVCRGFGLIRAEAIQYAAIERELRHAIVDPDRPETLAAQLRQLLRSAFSLRERLSIDNWRTVNRLVTGLGELRAERFPLGDAFALLDRTVISLMTLAGFAMDGMTRDQGWRFLSLGRRVERLQFLCASTRHVLATRSAEQEWPLELADSIVTYRSRYMARPQKLPVLDLLLMDPSNPRSVAFQLNGIRDYLERLADQFGALPEDPLAPGMQALAALDLPAATAARDGDWRLSALLEELSQGAYRLSDVLTLRYFSHVNASRQTVST